MPKSMQENQRSFKVAMASHVAETDFGRYIGTASRDAARKALRRILSATRDQDEAVLALRETTQWANSVDKSGSKLIFFHGERVKSTRRKPDFVMGFAPQYEYKVRKITQEEFQSAFAR